MRVSSCHCADTAKSPAKGRARAKDLRASLLKLLKKAHSISGMSGRWATLFIEMGHTRTAVGQPFSKDALWFPRSRQSLRLLIKPRAWPRARAREKKPIKRRSGLSRAHSGEQLITLQRLDGRLVTNRSKCYESSRMTETAGCENYTGSDRRKAKSRVRLRFQ